MNSDEGPHDDMVRLLLQIELFSYWTKIMESRSLADGLGIIVGNLVENWASLDARDDGETR